MISLFFAVILSWYFGGHDFRLHPDRMIASFISYSEKSLYREGSFKEGTFALVLNLVFVFGVFSLLFYFIRNAGNFWYFVFSTFVIYAVINQRFTKSEPDSRTSVEYMNYAMPVIAYTFLFGPAGALLYRTLTLCAHMHPATIEKYSEFGQPADKTLTLLRDAALLLVPALTAAASAVKKSIRFMKKFAP